MNTKHPHRILAALSLDDDPASHGDVLAADFALDRAAQRAEEAEADAHLERLRRLTARRKSLARRGSPIGGRLTGHLTT